MRADNHGMRLRSFPCLLLVMLAPAAHAQWIGWPPKPASPPSSTPNQPATASVRLRLVSHGAAREVWVDNDVSGPMEVRIDSRTRLQGFPLRQTLRGRGEHRVARLPADAPVSLRLTAVPGMPGVEASAASYRFPLLLPQIKVGQAPEGRFSHSDVENGQAIDFTAPIGTPVIAAREGTVMQVEGRFSDAPGQVDEANFVRLLHADGSMAIYAHLQRGSIEVIPGQHVEAGEVIARSGNSGYSSGPHLHFAVQVNRGMRLESVPVRIDTASGELRLPRTTAQP